jgi:hypothetical protein
MAIVKKLKKGRKAISTGSLLRKARLKIKTGQDLVRPPGYFKDAWSPEDIAWENQAARSVYAVRIGMMT